MREKVKKSIDTLLPELSKKLACEIPADLEYAIEIPKNKDHGDFAINLALKLATSAKRKPRDIALIIREILLNNSSLKKMIRDVKVEGPGFVNLFLTEKSRADVLVSIQKENGAFGRSSHGQGKKINIEFVSANPTGPLTIAHARQAVVGDTLARILKAVGFHVHREFYLNDAGKQVELFGQSVLARLKDGENAVIPEEGYRGMYVMDTAGKLKKVHPNLKPIDSSLPEITRMSTEEMLNQIKNDLKSIDVIFDEYYSEKSLYQNKLVEKVLEKLRKKGVIFESEGALWFRSTDFGDDKDRVLKKQTGEYTYFMPDIAYHEEKFGRGFNQLINLWGPDHHGYILRVKAAVQALGYLPEQLRILVVQLVTLYRRGEQVRMSKRAGEYVTLRDLVGEVGADATRFFFVMRRVESHLDFDLELAKEKSQDNPVYYLQYAHARICSILASANQKIDANANPELLTAVEEMNLLKRLGEYPDILKQAADSLEPYRLVDYLRELAALFHKFYAVCRVIGDDIQLTKARLLLTDCVRIVLRNGFQILGISQPEKM